jgi:hypothetical protein
MALSGPRDTKALGDNKARDLPVTTNLYVKQGGLVVMYGGYARPGRTATTDYCVGVAQADADNTGGADGAISVRVERGIFRFKNSTSGDAITRSDIGATCYIVDDEQVAKTNGTNTRSAAGKVWDVDALGVWVETP